MRNNKNNNLNTIQARVKEARRSAYSLMGAGLCGLNGSGVEVALMLYSTYIIPVMLYGLEALVLQESELDLLESFHKRNLRHILHLPTSTASPALFLLTGSQPIMALLRIKMLCMFRNIADSKGKSNPVKITNEVISRQIAMKKTLPHQVGLQASEKSYISMISPALTTCCYIPQE